MDLENGAGVKPTPGPGDPLFRHHLFVVPLEDGDELLLLLEPELPPDEEPDLLGEPDAPDEPELPMDVPPELPDEPLAESEPPPLPQAVSDKAAAATMTKTALWRVDECMRKLLE
jgi:hypothetical protein